MPRYLEVSGKIVESYTPDGYSRVDIVDTGYEYVYKLTPVSLTEEERELVNRVMDEIAYDLKPSELMKLSSLDQALHARGLPAKVIYIIEREVLGYSWLEPLMRDENLEDIQCFQADVPIRVTHRNYGSMQTNIVPSVEEIDRMVRILAYRGGSTIHRSQPVVDSVILPTGDRAALTYKGEVSPTSSFTIRKFPKHPWTPTRMMATGMVTPEAMAFLWLAIEAKMPIIIFGEMGSGKTSLANALGCLIRPTASIVLVQDVPEMNIPHENLIPLSERRSHTLGGVGEIGMEALVAHALRRSADYLLVNEVRYAEAKAFAQYVATGHGGITSFHAGSLNEVFARFKSLGVDESTMSSVKIMIHVGRFTVFKGGRQLWVRRIREIYYISGLRNYVPIAERLFEYDRARDVLVQLNIKNAMQEIAYKLMMSEKEVYEEYEIRKEFMRLALQLAKQGKLLEAHEWFDVLRMYYRDPIAAINRLRRELKQPELPAKVPIVVTHETTSEATISEERPPKPERAPEVRPIAVTATPAPSSPPSSTTPSLIRCPHCGAEIPSASTTCPRCGREIAKAEESELAKLEEELKKILEGLT